MTGLRGDHSQGWCSDCGRAGKYPQYPWLSAEEGEGVLEWNNDAQRERYNGTQPQTQQPQEEEGGPEGRLRKAG